MCVVSLASAIASRTRVQCIIRIYLLRTFNRSCDTASAKHGNKPIKP